MRSLRMHVEIRAAPHKHCRGSRIADKRRATVMLPFMCFTVSCPCSPLRFADDTARLEGRWDRRRHQAVVGNLRAADAVHCP